MCVMRWYMLLYVIVGCDVSKKVGSVCAPSILNYPAIYCYLPHVPLLPSPLSSYGNLFLQRSPSHSHFLCPSPFCRTTFYSPLTFLALFSCRPPSPLAYHLLVIPLTFLPLSCPCFPFPSGWIFSSPNSELARKVTKPMLIMPAGTVLYCNVM
jgi:hypothetical protein